MRISDWSSDVCSSDLIASLGICTVFYLLVSAGAIGSLGAQPVRGIGGEVLMPGTSGLADRCASLTALGTEPLVCSREALAHVLRSVGYEQLGNLIGLAAFLALPSVRSEGHTSELQSLNRRSQAVL